jgi:SIR2-like domain
VIRNNSITPQSSNVIDINSVIENPDDLVKLKAVIKSIHDKKCIAFVGAGMSRPAGYKDWETVVLELAKYVLEENEFNNIDFKNKKELPKIAQCCKETDFNKYKTFILNEFGRGSSPTKYHPNHISLWRIPFESIVTTNYDSCLYDAGGEVEKLKQIYTLPDLAINIKSGNLYHIHGLAFEIPNIELDLIRTIIFAESDYNNYYKSPINDLVTFFYSALQNYSFLFLGLSLSDAFINNMFEDLYHNLNTKSRALNTIANKTLKLPSHFLLYRDGDYDEKFIETLKKLNINLITYNSIDENYTGLEVVLNYLRNEFNKSILAPVPFNNFD